MRRNSICLAFGTLQTKGSDDQVAAVRHPEATFPGAVIDVDPVDLLGQRARDVGLESVAKVRRRQQAVDGDEQRPHLRGVGLNKWADADLGAQATLLLATACPYSPPRRATTGEKASSWTT
jgi:hypothetical protein